MHKTLPVRKFEKVPSTDSRIFRSQTVSQKNDLIFKKQMQFIAHILSNRPSSHYQILFKKTLHIYYLIQNLLFVICILDCSHILDCQKTASLDNQYGLTPHFIY